MGNTETRTANAEPDLLTKVQTFLYSEAELIDQGDYERWYELFTEDAIYWMPLGYGQTEADQYNALFYEDSLLLKVRIERLRHPRAFSQSPPSRCQHVLQPPRIEQQTEQGEGMVIATCTPFFYAESQADEQFWLAGTAHHELIATGSEETWRIHRKRIELLNREAALPSIQLFL